MKIIDNLHSYGKEREGEQYIYVYVFKKNIYR